ncbi:DUF441 domain-containing protein [Phosphitispora sp. TUW77]|uniref:DUF441 domain-containing protein n=1 Tax=Phosphitispora sp. TUW77 TaxID=3152361 RepID=UPI003AB82086
MWGEAILLSLIILGILGKSSIMAASSCILLVIKLTRMYSLFPLLERRSLELGLMFLMISVLVPFATGKVSPEEIFGSFTSITGVAAIMGGALAAYMNGQGLNMLKLDPELMVGIVVGGIIGIVILKGIPTGPLMAAGLTALFIKIVQIFR